MAIEYAWKILGLECDTADIPCTHISRIHWKLTGIENEYIGYAYGLNNIDYVFPESVTLSTITENDIIDLIIQGYGDNLSAITQPIEAIIAEQTYLINNNIPLPW